MQEAKRQGIYWYKPTADALAKLTEWNLSIINEAMLYNLPEQPDASTFAKRIKAINPNTKILVSFNAYSVFAKPDSTAGNPYWPIQQMIFKAAEETNAWLKIDGKFLEADKNTRMFDVRVPAFRYRLAEIINNALDSYEGIDGVHFDELHASITFLRSAEVKGLPGDDPRVKDFVSKLPTAAEWTAANKALLRLIDWPMMSNGNYDITLHHRTKSRGRYVQNATSIPDTLLWLKNDMELPIKQRWTTVNPVEFTDDATKRAWAKFCYSAGIGVQYWAGGIKNAYYNPVIEKLAF